MMISKRLLLQRIKGLEKKLLEPSGDKPKPPRLSVPVVDEGGEYVREWKVGYFGSGGYMATKHHELTFKEVCKALQDMCDIEITYQEIKGSSGVVIYEKDE